MDVETILARRRQRLSVGGRGGDSSTSEDSARLFGAEESGVQALSPARSAPAVPALLHFPAPLPVEAPKAEHAVIAGAISAATQLQAALHSLALGVYVWVATSDAPDPADVAMFLSVPARAVVFGRHGKGASAPLPGPVPVALITHVTISPAMTLILHTHSQSYSVRFRQSDSRDEWAYCLCCLHELWPLY